MMFFAIAVLVAVGAVPARPDGSIHVGGRPLRLIGTGDTLWMLTCDRGCSGEGRRSAGRIVRIDLSRKRVAGVLAVSHPSNLTVAGGDVYATDFWKDTIRRIDPATLRTTATLKLVLPFRFTPRDNAFLPLDVAVGPRDVWIATERCALARADRRLSRVLATIRLPCDTFGGLAVDRQSVWIGEALLGVYRVDVRTNRVASTVHLGPLAARLSPDALVMGDGRLFAVGTWSKYKSATERRGLARIDTARRTLHGVTPLPTGPLTFALGGHSLWVAQIGGSEIERIDARSGTVVARLHARVGVALAYAGGRLWTATANGTIRAL
jgi:hypothetical protein